MHNKSLMIQLIQQDLKHSQLTETLRQIGFDDFGLYSLDLMTIVAQLMQVPPKHIEHFEEIYGGYLDRAAEYPVTYLGEHLLPLAEECYLELLGCNGD